MKPELRLAVPPEVGVPIPLGDTECPQPDELEDNPEATEGGWCGRCDGSGRVPVVPTCQTCGGMGERHEELDVALLISCVQVGSGDWSWEQEFDILRSREHEDVMAELRPSIAQDGIRDAVLIGTDGRVWDGHHRICVADELNARIPVCWLCPDCTDGVARRWVGTVTVAGGPCPECKGQFGGKMPGHKYGSNWDWVPCQTCGGKDQGSLPDRRYRLQGAVVPVVAFSDSKLNDTEIAIDQFGNAWLFRCGAKAEVVTAAFPDGPPAVGTWAVVPETIEEEA